MTRLALALLLFTPAVASAQDATPACKLRWFGNSFFQLETTGGKKIVFDPHAIPALTPPQVTADIVLLSHEHSDHTQLQMVRDIKAARVFRGLKDVNKRPEWNAIDEQVGKVHIHTVGLYHDNQEGFSRGKNAAFIVTVDGLTFCHLGDIGHVPTDAQAKAIGLIDVLMVPVGGVYTLNGDGAKRTVEKLKPRLYVLPMHYAVPGYDELVTAEEFLDGKLAVKRMLETNELTIPPDAKADAPTVIVLGHTAKK